VTICPCCGFRFEGDLRTGCEGCGARAVGEPLPKPEHELPAYGRPLLLVVTGMLMVLAFFAQTVAALIKDGAPSLNFWSWVAAAETAAWRVKWISIPVTFVVLWGGRRVYRSMMQVPARFVGMKMARRALVTSAFVSFLIATLIGITVPDRLRQRQFSIEATTDAQIHTYERARLEYQALHGTVPANPRDLLELADPDGSIAAAVNEIDPAFYKTSGANMAEVSPKPRTLSGAALRNTSMGSATEESPAQEFSLTTYEFRLPGEDKIYGTDDDVIVRDGVRYTVSEAKAAPIPARAPRRVGKR